MKTKMQVNSIKNLWVPPFSKERETEEVDVGVGEEFHSDKITKQNVFKLLDANSNYAIIGYNSTFHLKRTNGELEELMFQGYKALKLPIGREVSFSHMWGDYGITKTITYLMPIDGAVKAEVEQDDEDYEEPEDESEDEPEENPE
ncbi:MAG: hypothetical protein COT55_00465 [Candidatus Diapherotrites archaeon CG09_land_8_20_14_0_10_32_12]|nr:MAG: hypothetical protein COT55_00465 [Candidatus Diapherotrites archaeon CG09_land_8_20_14_0_10_32_12]